MNRQPPGLAERAVHRRRRREPGQRWDPLVGEASNESKKMGNGEGRLEAGRRSAASAVTCGAEGGGQAARRVTEERGGDGAEDREEGTEDIEEQRAFIAGPSGIRARYPVGQG